MKFLIVDDDPRSRHLIRTALDEPGMEFFEGNDGREAIQLYEAHRPDWVIMDIEMEPVDGIMATRTIRRRDPKSRVVIVSQHNSLRFSRAARAAGAWAYVLKDDLHDLRNILANAAKAPTEVRPLRP